MHQEKAPKSVPIDMQIACLEGWAPQSLALLPPRGATQRTGEAGSAGVA